MRSQEVDRETITAIVAAEDDVVARAVLECIRQLEAAHGSIGEPKRQKDGVLWADGQLCFNRRVEILIAPAQTLIDVVSDYSHEGSALLIYSEACWSAMIPHRIRCSDNDQVARIAKQVIHVYFADR